MARRFGDVVARLIILACIPCVFTLRFILHNLAVSRVWFYENSLGRYAGWTFSFLIDCVVFFIAYMLITRTRIIRLRHRIPAYALIILLSFFHLWYANVVYPRAGIFTTGEEFFAFAPTIALLLGVEAWRIMTNVIDWERNGRVERGVPTLELGRDDLDELQDVTTAHIVGQLPETLELGVDDARTLTFLYRFYDVRSRLLYVGITQNLDWRLTNHADKKEWFQSVHRVTIKLYGSGDEARRAERDAIRNEGPLHNVVHNRGKNSQPVNGQSTLSPDE